MSSLQGDLQVVPWINDVLPAGPGGQCRAQGPSLLAWIALPVSTCMNGRSSWLSRGSVFSIVRQFLFLLQENLQIYLKSTQGPIEVYLCPEEVQEPDSPAKEALPSASTLSPIPDFAEPSCSTDPGITETTASSGRPSVPWERR